MVAIHQGNSQELCSTSHGIFSFAQILDARDRETTALGGGLIRDFNESVYLCVESRKVMIIVNRGQKTIVTMYTVTS